MAKDNPSKTEIAPSPPNVTPPSPPEGAEGATPGQNAPPPAPVSHTGLPPVLNPNASTSSRLEAEQALRASVLDAPPPAVAPRTLADLAAVPAGPREIPLQEGDPEPIRPARTMGGLSFVNDHVEPGSTPLTPDHVNPIATAEQRRDSIIKTVEEADLADRRRMHAEHRPQFEEEIARREAAGEPLTRP